MAVIAPERPGSQGAHVPASGGWRGEVSILNRNNTNNYKEETVVAERETES